MHDLGGLRMNKIESKALKVLRLDKVKQKTGYGRTSIYNRMSEGTFPKSISLGARAVGWLEHEIDAWIMECVKNRYEV